MGSGGELTKVVIVDLKVRNKIKKMSREQPREEDGAMGTEVGPVGDKNVETEERPPTTGVIGTETDKRDLSQTNRFGSLGGAKPKRPKFELSNSRIPGPRWTPSGTGEHPEESGTERFSFEMLTPMYPGPGREPPGAGARPVTPVNDQYTFGIPAPADPGLARQSPVNGYWDTAGDGPLHIQTTATDQDTIGS